MKLTIENPFGDCAEEGHLPKWEPYPHYAYMNKKDRRIGMILCQVCLELLDYGVERGAISGHSTEENPGKVR